MRDTSIYSFKDEESKEVQSALKVPEKEKTIISRKIEEFDRVNP